MFGRLIECGVDPNITLKNGSTAMWGAAYDGSPEAIQILLNGKADVNLVRSDTQSSALTIAAENNHLPAVRILLANGADTTQKWSQGETAYDVAMRKGYSEIARVLKAAAP